MQNARRRHLELKILVAVILGATVAFHLVAALTGHPYFRAIHLGTAVTFAHGALDLWHPIITGFSANSAPIAQELPVWQATVASIFKITNSDWPGWANVVSLMFFAAGLWPVWQLARQFAGERAAWWTLVFFLAQPLVVFTAGLGSADGFCLMATNWFLFFATRLVTTGRIIWWPPAVIFAGFSVVSKLPFFMAAGLAVLCLLLSENPRSIRRWLLLASTGLAAAAIFLGWTQHTNRLCQQAEFPYVELRLNQNPFICHWYFGDAALRLSASAWLKGGWRFAHAILGALPLAVLLLCALFRRGQRLPKLWLAATIPVTLVFTNLVLAHWHYYLMCSLPVALLCGATVAAWEDSWSKFLPSAALRTLIAGGVLSLAAVDGLVAMKIFTYRDPFPAAMAAVLKTRTGPADRLIIYTVDTRWGGEELFRAGRNGFYVFDLENVQGAATTPGLRELLTDPAKLQRLKQLGYNRLVLISQSPAWLAAQAGTGQKRVLYPASVSPTVDQWPVAYRSDDILIQEIP
jgi:hypothetical protein